MNPKTRTILTVVFGVTCIGIAVVGGRALLDYESTPGEIGIVAKSWPNSSGIHPDPDKPTLVMMVHPQCPCSRASMDELARIMARLQGKVRTYVLFYTPRDAGDDWQNTDTRRSASQIPGVTVLSDIDGQEAERFGAETSGHVFLFDPRGHLLFNGGITASRGHSGDNAGESAIVSLIANESAGRAQTFVFGCSFKNKSDRDRKCSK